MTKHTNTHNTCIDPVISLCFVWRFLLHGATYQTDDQDLKGHHAFPASFGSLEEGEYDEDVDSGQENCRSW